MPRGDAVGFNAMLRERQNNRRQQALTLNDEVVPQRNFGLWISLLIWAGFCAATAWAFYNSMGTGTRIFSTIGLIWSGLWTRFLALDHKMPRLSELAILTTLTGFVCLMMTATLQMGYPLSFAGGLLTLMAAALIVSVINNSKIALMCTIGGGLIWAALQMDGYLETGTLGMFLPALWALAVLQAIRMKTLTGVLVSVITGYIWLGGSAYQAYMSETLSALYLCTGATVIGNLHYRAAKAAEDEGFPLMEWNVSLGWIIANMGLLALARFGLDPANVYWANSHDISSVVRIAWMGLMAGAILIYGGVSLIRRRHKHMSAFGIFLTTLLLAALPAAILFLPTVETTFHGLTNLELYPAAGLFLFGIVTGHILFFISNAFRRHKYIQVVTALMMTAFLAYMAKGIDLAFQEAWVVWLLGTMAAALVSLIAVEPQLADQDPELRVSVSSS